MSETLIELTEAEFDRRFTAHRMAQDYLKLYARLAQGRRVPMRPHRGAIPRQDSGGPARLKAANGDRRMLPRL